MEASVHACTLAFTRLRVSVRVRLRMPARAIEPDQLHVLAPVYVCLRLHMLQHHARARIDGALG
eukprot:11213643-Alexandrium_andersonii.AAC.1